MKILVVGSNGRVGSLVVKEAINKGLNVVGLAKNENKSLASNFILKDALNLTSDDVKDFDVRIQWWWIITRFKYLWWWCY